MSTEKDGPSRTGTAIVLAGGRNTRMGRDKSLLTLNGLPIIELVTEALRPHFAEIIISTNEPEKFKRYGYECVPDEVEGAGPAVGMMSVMRRFPRDYYQVVACDTPFIEGAAAARVYKLAAGADAAIVRTPDGFPQALFSAYSINCLPAFEISIRNGINKVMRCISRLNVIYVPSEELGIKAAWEKHFFNINTPEDIENAEKLL